MDIERINEHTVKFTISYGDIEKRGFSKEEIWNNREKGEQLFWEMIEEASFQDEFVIDGPLWIQVQALETCIEVLVSKPHTSPDGQKLELPFPMSDKHIQVPVNTNVESLLQQMGQMELFNKKENKPKEEFLYSYVFSFRQIEDIISLSHRMLWESVETNLYEYEGVYYLHTKFDQFLHERNTVNMFVSLILEYGMNTTMTIYKLQEYGNCIIGRQALSVFPTYFSHE